MKRGGRRMPWKNLPPGEIASVLANMLGLMLAGLMGTLTRILDQIDSGVRDKIWSRELITDAMGFILMLVAAAGISEYFSLERISTAALAGVLCRGGTPMLDTLFYSVLKRLRGGKK